MNVNGVTPSAPNRSVETGAVKSKAAVRAQRADTVSIGSQDAGRSLQVVADRSLQKILEMTRAAAQELGVDLATFDPSPEAVSSRISDFAINLFGLYRKQNPDMGDEEALNSYQDLINGAIDKGYQEALSVLSSVGINDQGILDQAANTIQMAHDKFNHFITESLKLVRENGALPNQGPPLNG